MRAHASGCPAHQARPSCCHPSNCSLSLPLPPFSPFSTLCTPHSCLTLSPCRYALDHIPKNQANSLYQRFVSFEKQHGDRQGIEDVVVSKRRWGGGGLRETLKGRVGR